MKEIFELPPMLTGSAQQQILELRDYLVRLVLQINEEAQA